MEGDKVLEKGTEVSAKFKGAYCEAVIDRVEPALELRVNFLVKGKGSHLVSDKDVKGEIKLQSQVEAKHPSDGAFYPATIIKITDNSIYFVEFDDGDTERLKRAGIRLKGSKHFSNTATIDALPLTDPEKFALAPVIDAPKPEPVTPKPGNGGSKKQKTSTAPPKSSKSGSKATQADETEGDAWAPKRPAFFVEALGATFWRPAVMVPDEEVDETMPAKSDPADRIVRYLDDLSFCCVRERSLRPFGRDAPLYKHFVRESRKAFLDDKGVQAAIAYIDHMHTPDGFMWAQFAKKAHAERARAQARAYRESQAPRSAPQPEKSNRSGPASSKAKTTPRPNGTSVSGQQSGRVEPPQSPARSKQDAPSTPVKPPSKAPSTPIPSFTSSQQGQKQKKRRHELMGSEGDSDNSDEDSVGGKEEGPGRKSTKRAKSEQRKERVLEEAPVWGAENSGGGGEKKHQPVLCPSKQQRLEQSVKKSAGEDTASEDSRRMRPLGRVGRTDSMSSSDVGSPLLDSELLHEGWMYKLGDRVWAMSYLDGKIYEAKVVKRQLMSTGREKRGSKSGPSALSNYRHMPVPHYYCRYKGWGERYAEWIEESQVFCSDPAAGITEKTRKRVGGHVDAVSAFEKPPKRQRSTSESLSLSDIPSDLDLKEVFEEDKDTEEVKEVVVVEEKRNEETEMGEVENGKEIDSKEERRRERKKEKKKKSGKKSRSGKRKEKRKVEENTNEGATERKEELEGDEKEEEEVGKREGESAVGGEGTGKRLPQEVKSNDVDDHEESVSVKEEVVGDVMEVECGIMEVEEDTTGVDRREEGESMEVRCDVREDVARMEDEGKEEEERIKDERKERRDKMEGKEKKSKKSHSKSRDRKGKHKKGKSKSKDRERSERGSVDVEGEGEEEEREKEKPEDSSGTDANAACMILDESHTTEHHEPATPTTTNQSSMPVSHSNRSNTCVSMDTDDVDVSGTPLPTPTSPCKSLALELETEKPRENVVDGLEGFKNDGDAQPTHDAAANQTDRLQDPTETHGVAVAEMATRSAPSLKAGECNEGTGLAAEAPAVQSDTVVISGTKNWMPTDQSDTVSAPPASAPQPIETRRPLISDYSKSAAAATTTEAAADHDAIVQGVKEETGVKSEYGAARTSSAPQTSEECEVVVVDVVETAPSPPEPTRLRTRKQSASSAGTGPGEEEAEEDMNRLTTTRGRTGNSLRRVRTISEDIAECEEAGRMAALAALGGDAHNKAPPSLRRPVRNSTAKPPRSSKSKGDDGEASVGEHSAHGGSDGGFVRPMRNSASGKNGKSGGGGKLVDVEGDGVSVSQQSGGHGKRKGGSSKKGKNGSGRHEKKERGSQSKSCTIYTSRTHKQSLESGVTLTKEEFKVSHKYDKNGVTISDEHIHEVKHTVEDRITNQRTTNRVLSCTNEKPVPIDELETRMDELRRQYMEHRMELARLDRLKHSKKRPHHHHHHHHSITSSTHNHHNHHQQQHASSPRIFAVGAHSSPRIGQSDTPKAHSSPVIFVSDAMGRGRSPVLEVKRDPIAHPVMETKPTIVPPKEYPVDSVSDVRPCESVAPPPSIDRTTNPPAPPLEQGVPPVAAPLNQSESAFGGACTDSAMKIDPPSFSVQPSFEFVPSEHGHGHMQHVFAMPDHMQTVNFHHPMVSIPHPMYGGIMVGGTEVLSPLQAICAAIDLIGSMDAAMAKSGSGDSVVGSNVDMATNQSAYMVGGVMDGPVYVVNGPVPVGLAMQTDTSPEISAISPNAPMANKDMCSEIAPAGENNHVSSGAPLDGHDNGPCRSEPMPESDPTHAANRIEPESASLLPPPTNDSTPANANGSPNVWDSSFTPAPTSVEEETNVFAVENKFVTSVAPMLMPGGLTNGPCVVPPIAKVSGISTREENASPGMLECFGNVAFGAAHSSEHSLHTTDSILGNEPDSGVVESLNLPHETVTVVDMKEGGVVVGVVGVVDGMLVALE